MNAIDEMKPGKVTAVILAGGKGRRMGGVDKGLIELDGKPLIEHVITRIRPQVDQLIISANRNIERYQRYGYPVMTDQIKNQGPLGGILAALQQCQSDWLLTQPCDTPYLPSDLLFRFHNTSMQTPATLYTVHDGHRSQTLFSMVHQSLAKPLQEYLDSGNRKVALWLDQQDAICVNFSDQPNAFVNINTNEALKNIQNKPDHFQFKEVSSHIK